MAKGWREFAPGRWGSCLLAFGLTCCSVAVAGELLRREVPAQAELPGGEAIREVRLRNAAGMEVTVTSWGATLTGVHLPDREGTVENVTLHLDSAAAQSDESRLLEPRRG